MKNMQILITLLIVLALGYPYPLYESDSEYTARMKGHTDDLRNKLNESSNEFMKSIEKRYIFDVYGNIKGHTEATPGGGYTIYDNRGMYHGRMD